jgi:hypothetical protein
LLTLASSGGSSASSTVVTGPGPVSRGYSGRLDQWRRDG